MAAPRGFRGAAAICRSQRLSAVSGVEPECCRSALPRREFRRDFAPLQERQMSVTMSVFVHSNKLPQPTAWAQAIRSNGFPMELSTGFDVRKQAGFVPCTYDGQKAGF